MIPEIDMTVKDFSDIIASLVHPIAYRGFIGWFKRDKKQEVNQWIYRLVESFWEVLLFFTFKKLTKLIKDGAYLLLLWRVNDDPDFQNFLDDNYLLDKI